MIPYGHQSIKNDDIREISRALKSDFITQGPRVAEFERRLALFCGSKYAVVVNSGTAALHCAYFAAGIKSGDEIITSPNSFAATANAALYLGAKPIFCDIRPDTYNLDENKIEPLISEKTRAIVPVHFAGQACEMEPIKKIARKNNLIVIDDACHALGGFYKNKKIGNGGIADLTVFSFHPVKSITCGEGGAVLTNNKKFYERMLKFRNHGIVKKQSPPWFYEMHELGFNYRMNDIQCALGISQLKKIRSFIRKREAVADYYYKKLKNTNGLILPAQSKYAKSAWHLFPVRVGKKQREKVFNDLRKAGIGVQVFYIPIYWHPYYKKIGYKKGICPNAEEFYSASFSLPIFPDLTRKEQDFVIDKCKSILQKY